MRKISHRPADHNIARVLLPGIALLILAWAAPGCRQAAEQRPQAAPENRDCPVQVDAQAWRSFARLAGPMSQGQAIPAAQLEAYAQLPEVADWRESLAPNSPQTAELVDWFETSWPAQSGGKPGRKFDRNRTSMTLNFRYAQEHTSAIDSLLELYTTGNARCELSELVDYWIDPARVPQPLVINFLPTMPEVRVYAGKIYADVGVLAAGGLVRMNLAIAALLYRNLEILPGTNPLEAEGEQAIVECLRVMMNQGVAAWIEQTSDISFDSKHYFLGSVRIIPVDFYTKARQTFARFEASLPAMLADPAIMAARSQTFARGMAGGNSFLPTGLAAADLIAARLGKDRLREVKSSPADFLAAYQAAARQNKTPLPEPGQIGTQLYESLPPLTTDLYESLQALLKRHS